MYFDPFGRLCPNTGLMVIPVDEILAAEQQDARTASPATSTSPARPAASAPVRTAATPKPTSAPAATAPIPVTKREPVMPATKSPTDIVAEWNRRVKAEEAAGTSKSRAPRAVAMADPEFHQEYLAAYKSLSMSERLRANRMR